MSIRIKNGLILSQDQKRRIYTGDVFVEDNRITEISENPISVEADLIIDADGKLVLPGLINTHTHVPMTLLRGYGDDMVLQDWLKERIWPVEAKLNKEVVAAASKLAFLEMIASGTTLFQDMYFFEDTIGNIAREMGIRGFLGFALIDSGTPEYPTEDLFSNCEQFLNKWKNDDLITPVIAPHGAYTCGPESLSQVKALSERYKVRVHTHCAETRDEVYQVKETYGKRPVDQFDSLNLLDENMILAHCGWITKTEIDTMQKRGVSVSHCPVSNMKIGTGGYAPVPEMLKADIAVSLGTDGAASNNSLDLFETMKFCALVHKQHRWDPRVLTAQTVFDMATILGAKALGMNKMVGSIESGKRADIILIDLKKPHLAPCHDPISHVVYAVKGSDVCTSIINGEMVYHDYQFTLADQDSIINDASTAAKDLISMC